MVSSILVNVTSLLLALDCLFLAFVAWRGREFLKTTPEIASAADFVAYQRLVAVCMKATFGFVLLFTAAGLVCTVGASLGWVRIVDLESVAIIGVIRVMGGALLTLQVEGRLKTIPTHPRWHVLQKEVIRLWDAEPWPSRVYRVGLDTPAAGVEIP